MYRVFNMGLGMVLACERGRVSEVCWPRSPARCRWGKLLPTLVRGMLFYSYGTGV